MKTLSLPSSNAVSPGWLRRFIGTWDLTAERLLGRALLAACTLALLAYAYVGTFTRYMADDFVFAHVAQARGVVGAESFWYTHWFGRFTDIFLLSIASLWGPVAVRVLPVVLLTLLVSAIYWTASQAVPIAVSLRSVEARITLSLVVVLALLLADPNLVQTVYWESGSLPYFAPLILFVVVIGILLRARLRGESKLLAISAFLVAFVSAGCSETYMAFQLACLGLLAFAWRRRKTGIRGFFHSRVLTAALAGGLLGATVVVLAPGNHIRAFDGPHMPISLSVVTTITEPLILMLVGGIALVAGAVLMVGGLLALDVRLPNLSPRKVAGVAWLIAMACIAPSTLVHGAVPPGRALLEPQVAALALLSFLVILLGGKATLAIRRHMHQPASTLRVLRVVVIAAASLVALFEAGHQMQAVRSSQAHAAAWDHRDSLIRTAVRKGARHMTVRALPEPGSIDPLGRSTSFFVNSQMATYYRLDYLVSK